LLLRPAGFPARQGLSSETQHVSLVPPRDYRCSREQHSRRELKIGTLAGCPADTQAYVFTLTSTGGQQASFYVVFYG